MEGGVGKFGCDVWGGLNFVKEWEYCWFESEGLFDDLKRGGDIVH